MILTIGGLYIMFQYFFPLICWRISSPTYDLLTKFKFVLERVDYAYNKREQQSSELTNVLISFIIRFAYNTYSKAAPLFVYSYEVSTLHHDTGRMV